MLLNRWQTTLAAPVVFSGKGLHSGRVVTMQVKPAPANHGLVFARTDVAISRKLQGRADLICTTMLSTTLGEGSTAISTIEHLMAAFAGLGITNAMVCVDAPEIPIMDGSAIDFVRGFLAAGIVELPALAVAFRLKKRLSITEGDKHIVIEPSESQRIRCTIDFRSPVIGRQTVDYRENLDSFLSIADARTFCHFSDVQAMREKGLALGGGLDNAIVVTDSGVMNDTGLRSADEFVKHKLLDLIGDFATLGAPLLADIQAFKSGHSLHAKAIQFLLENRSVYLEEFFPDQLGASGGGIHQGRPSGISAAYA